MLQRSSPWICVGGHGLNHWRSHKENRFGGDETLQPGNCWTSSLRDYWTLLSTNAESTFWPEEGWYLPQPFVQCVAWHSGKNCLFLSRTLLSRYNNSPLGGWLGCPPCSSFHTEEDLQSCSKTGYAFHEPRLVHLENQKYFFSGSQPLLLALMRKQKLNSPVKCATGLEGRTSCTDVLVGVVTSPVREKYILLLCWPCFAK